MSLKTLPSSDGESPLLDPWSGLWGTVVPDAKSLAMLRVELPARDGKQESHGFAYSGLSRWLCRKIGEDEHLQVYLGKHVINVKGRSLTRLLDALEEGRLKLIRVCQEPLQTTGPWIESLTVETIP